MTELIDIRDLHHKWQKRWADEKIYQPKAGKGEKFYLTAAYPYPNSPQHIGHARTYTTTDIYARFQRMSGKNTLFPMGFHVTGTPIIGMAKRLEDGDAELYKIFNDIYNISKETAKTLTDPKELVTYFSKDIEAGMREMGYAIDWRRKFYTFDEHYTRFITWQFHKLKQAGCIIKGKHPVPWCSKDGQVVGGHDTKGDVDPKIEQVITIFFKTAENTYIPTFTYRPETLFGVTNLWANKDAKYILAKYEDRQIYLTQIAFDTLSEQLPLEKIKDVSSDEILSLQPEHPLTSEKLQIFDAQFVKEDVGTGLVMSVPAHAPFDYLALRDSGLLDKIQLKAVMKTPDFKEFPAKEIVEQMRVKDQKDPKAEEATKILYKKEAHEGKMIIEGYEGLNGNTAKEKIKEKLLKDSKAIEIYTLANGPVYSRSGGICTVKIVDNQWFIDYGDKEWKKKTMAQLSNMKIMPEVLRKDFEYTVDWLEQKACTRAFGLGTKFPFDEKQMIEALSDSTVYMAFYTISHITKEMDPEELNEEFFDYVFLDKEPSDSSKITENWKNAKAEFQYWYPLDSRHSALDLVHNHLTFLIYNHVAIFPEKYWPKQIVGNGFVTMDGAKMSKSMGNILPLRKAIAQYGPDVIRFIVTSTAELEKESDFNRPAAEGVISRIKELYSILDSLESENQEIDEPGKWFYSRLHEKIRKAKTQYENLELRSLAQAILYDSINDINWYRQRSDNVQLREFFEYWTLLASPFMPHITEEFWEKLGKKQFVQDSDSVILCNFPEADESKIDPKLDTQEDYLCSVMEDISSIQRLIKKDRLDSITLIIHSPVKEKIRNLVATHKNMPTIMQKAKEDPELAQDMKSVSKYAARYLKSINKMIGDSLGADAEYAILDSAKDFLQKEFKGAQIQIIHEKDATGELEKKADFAAPNKPSIIIN